MIKLFDDADDVDDSYKSGDIVIINPDDDQEDILNLVQSLDVKRLAVPTLVTTYDTSKVLSNVRQLTWRMGIEILGQLIVSTLNPFHLKEYIKWLDNNNFSGLWYMTNGLFGKLRELESEHFKWNNKQYVVPFMHKFEDTVFPFEYEEVKFE